MPAGFRNAGGVDFDSVFDPYVQGTKPTDTGFRTSDGVDLANRYAPIEFGTKAADVGFRTSGGVDLSNLWAAFGTAVYQTINQLLQPGYNVLILPGWSGASGIDYSYRLLLDGTASADRGPAEADDLFDWTSDGNPPIKAYEVRLIDVSESGDAAWQFFNDIASWSTLNSSTSRTVCRMRYNSTTAGGESRSVTARLQIREAVSLAVVYDEVFTAEATAGF